MRKQLYLFGILFIFSIIVQAQEFQEPLPPPRIASGFRLAMNGNLILPFGNVSGIYTSGIGGGITAKYILDGTLGLGLVFNYNLMGGRAPSFGTVNSYVNYGAVLEYYFPKMSITPLLGIELTNNRFSSTFSANASGNNFSNTNDNNNLSGLGFTPYVGALYSINNIISATINLKYTHVFAPIFPTQLVTIQLGLLFTITSN